ncbi:MAG: redox-regulated ATPase YchF, partial [Candidatus Cloacimonetes bacterium]|nr:redox-regulated ATPase YchF [Candidatus Cloacimonadota bacterium]
GKHEYFSGQNLASIKTADALGIVVRNFADSIISEALGEPDPVRDINIIDTELIISDLIIVENRLEKIELSKKRGIKETSLIIEEQALLKAREHLNDNKPLYSLNFNDDEEKSIRGFQFLSKKPCLYIINSDENNFGKNDSIFSAENSLDIIEFAGKFELELSKLDPNEAKEFMEDFGLDSSTRERLIKFAYNKLGYISFFTVGSKEVHAWNLQKGQNALEAAGTIHSDMERGFIRAECYNFSDLLHHGSEKELRNHGLLRLEGKNYIVSDGDVITIRFNV